MFFKIIRILPLQTEFFRCRGGQIQKKFKFVFVCSRDGKAVFPALTEPPLQAEIFSHGVCMFFFFAGPFIPALYVSCHVLAFKKLPLLPRAAAAALLVIISQIYPINIFLFKNLSGPDMPAALLKIQTALFASLVMLFLLLLGRDVLKLAAFLVRALSRRPLSGQKPDESRRRFLRGGLSAAFAAGAPALSLAGGACGVAEGTVEPALHAVTAFLPTLPPELDGLRIVQLTDIHIGPLTSAEKIRNMANLALSASPDLVCITGDIADGLTGYRAEGGGTRLEAARELAALKAPLGVWACTGNHEYYSDYDRWMSVYRSLGIRFLHGEAIRLLWRNTEFLLAGLDDPMGLRFGRARTASLAEALPQGKENRPFCIVMDHRPGRASENAAAGAGLQLSGHTHGGQCFGMDAFVARANRGYVRGWYTVGAMQMYVSPGAGLWSGLPVRLGVPAEIPVITLRRGQPAQ